jgi:hypothetical protein
VVAYTLLQVVHNQPRQEGSFDDLEYERFRAAVKFLVDYLSEWTTHSGVEWWFFEGMHSHSMRYFEITDSPPTERLLSLNGIPITRETVRLTNTQAYLHERRASLALFGTNQDRLPCFTIIFVADNMIAPFNDGSDSISRSHFASMHLFINIIFRAIDQTCGAWERVLTELDTELNITVRTQLAMELRRLLY